MKQLLDTHTFLWFVMGNDRITPKLRAQIEDNENFVSIVSIWEIAIKNGIGKLNLEVSFDNFVDQQIIPNGIQILDIKLEHLKVLITLPLYHRDPFVGVASPLGESYINCSSNNRRYPTN